MNYEPYFQAHIWSCLTCGFIYVGGQPKLECPVCQAYKANFVNLPQHLEAQARDAFPDLPPNHKDVRAKRVELMKENDVRGHCRVHGRVLPGESGEHIDIVSEDHL